MESGGLLRSEQNKEDVGRSSVNGIEINPSFAYPEADHHGVKLFELAVGNADTLADTCAAQLLRFA